MKVIITPKYAQVDLVNELLRPFDAAVDSMLGWLSKPRSQWKNITPGNVMKMNDKELKQTIREQPAQMNAFMNDPNVSDESKAILSGKAAKNGERI
jgi:hypothetical protein